MREIWEDAGPLDWQDFYRREEELFCWLQDHFEDQGWSQSQFNSSPAWIKDHIMAQIFRDKDNAKLLVPGGMPQMSVSVVYSRPGHPTRPFEFIKRLTFTVELWEE